MAFSISISPQAINRPNLKNKNPRHKPKPKSLKPPKPNPPRPPPSLSSVPGGQATTYTRLPPRDDSFSSPSPSPTSEEESSLVIKLSDLAIPNPPSNQTRNRKKFGKNASREKPPVSKIASKTDDSKFDYGKFQLFEGDDDGEDDDELELGIEGNEEWIGVGEGEEQERDEGEIEVKEKGVPAVMRCFDRAKIFVKAGDGGNGVMAFRREKYVPLGGPSGGDGGRGGNVYLEVEWSMSSLLPFRQSIHFRAGRGSHGQGKKMHGAKGEDVVVKVPPGTIVKNGEDGEVLLELLRPGERALVLPGGKGGRGNASFKSGLNKVPKIAEDGEEGAEMLVFHRYYYCLLLDL